METSLPFSACLTSLYMQTVANAITYILRRQGIPTHMYLDDNVVPRPDMAEARHVYDITRSLLNELGLPTRCSLPARLLLGWALQTLVVC